MSRTIASFALFAFFALTACAANPRPGEPGYPYNPSGTYSTTFVVDEVGTYTGTMEATTAPGGAVTGSFSITGGVTVTGAFTGTLTGDSLTWSGTYTLAEVDCPGMITSAGTVAEGGDSIAGTVDVVGCDASYGGTYTATRP